MPPRLAIIAAILFASASPAAAAQGVGADTAGGRPAAQGDEAPPLGSLVRVTQSVFSRRRLRGTVVGFDSLGLTLAIHGPSDRVTVPLAKLQRVEVSDGRLAPDERVLRGVKRGLVIGTVTSAAVVLVTARDAARCECEGEAFATALFYSIPFTAATAVLGGIVRGLGPGERWRAVPLPRPTPQPVHTAPAPEDTTAHNPSTERLP
jgi:hypothetical protein